MELNKYNFILIYLNSFPLWVYYVCSQVVAILENLNQAYRERQENEVEVELLREENINLKGQFDKEKLLRKTMEQVSPRWNQWVRWNRWVLNGTVELDGTFKWDGAGEF